MRRQRTHKGKGHPQRAVGHALWHAIWVTIMEHTKGGGGVCGGKILPWDISQRVYFACSPEFAVGNFAPTCCEPTFGWWWLLLFADALQLSPGGLLFLPDEKR